MDKAEYLFEKVASRGANIIQTIKDLGVATVEVPGNIKSLKGITKIRNKLLQQMAMASSTQQWNNLSRSIHLMDNLRHDTTLDVARGLILPGAGVAAAGLVLNYKKRKN